MSTTVSIDFYSKKDGIWENDFHSKEFNFLKNLSSYRNCMENIEGAPLSEEDYEELEKLTHKYDDFEYDFQGSIILKDWIELGIDGKAYEAESGEKSFIIDKSDLEKCKEKFLSFEELIKIRNSENDFEYVNIYIEKTSPRGYYNGFYNISSFENYREKISEEFNKLLIKKNDLQRVQSSIEYLKLSSEEKENVMSDVSSNEEALKDVDWQLRTVDYVIGIFELFGNEYETQNAVMYVYSS